MKPEESKRKEPDWRLHRKEWMFWTLEMDQILYTSNPFCPKSLPSLHILQSCWTNSDPNWPNRLLMKLPLRQSESKYILTAYFLARVCDLSQCPALTVTPSLMCLIRNYVDRLIHHNNSDIHIFRFSYLQETSNSIII